MKEVTLLDTGPWVASIDSGDNQHRACLEWIKGHKGKFISTLAVLTETLYLLNHAIKAQQACFNWIYSGTVKLVEMEPKMLARAETLMMKYKDIPMDFADATIVVLAEKFGINRIFTLDQRGFEVFKYDRRKKFELVGNVGTPRNVGTPD